MAYRATGIALLLASLAMAGCGTVANLAEPFPEGGKSPFGGVRHDVACIQRAANEEFGVRTHPLSDTEQCRQVALMLFCAADLPFTLIGDVVTWPYAASYTCVNQPVPLPPLVHAPSPPPTPVNVEGQPLAPPLETLPQPKLETLPQPKQMP